MRWPMSLVAAALVAVGLAALVGRRTPDLSVPQTNWAIQTNMVAPLFNAMDSKGDPLRLEDLRGRYVLLDFWFTTCPPCIDEVPRIRALQEKYAEQLTVVGVSIDRDREAFERFLQRQQMDWPQILDVLDNEGALQSLYQVSYYPSYWLVNPDGQVALHGRHVVGVMHSDGLRFNYD